MTEYRDKTNNHATRIAQTPPAQTLHHWNSPHPMRTNGKLSPHVRRVIKCARGWVGQDFRRGEEGQCANFVRRVFADAHVSIGNAAHPSDQRLLNNPNDLGAGYADSFAGNDVGAKVSEQNILPGDIVMYPNTYGNFRLGVITHVAIYIGNGQIIHRPTKSGPVALDRVNIFPIAEIRRPIAFANAANLPHSGSAKVFVHDELEAAFLNNGPVHSADIRITVRNGEVKAHINGRPVEPSSLSLQLFY